MSVWCLRLTSLALCRSRSSYPAARGALSFPRPLWAWFHTHTLFSSKLPLDRAANEAPLLSNGRAPRFRKLGLSQRLLGHQSSCYCSSWLIRKRSEKDETINRKQQPLKPTSERPHGILMHCCVLLRILRLLALPTGTRSTCASQYAPSPQFLQRRLSSLLSPWVTL